MTMTNTEGHRVLRAAGQDRRLAHAYRSEGDRLVLFDEAATGKWSRPPTCEHGAAGLVSTVDDYLAFARMLLADGRHRGQPLLTPARCDAVR